MHHQRLRTAQHRQQRLHVAAFYQRAAVIAAYARRRVGSQPFGGIKQVDQLGIGRRTRTSSQPRASFAQLDILERPRPGDGGSVGRQADDSPLTAEHSIARIGHGGRAGDAGHAVNGKMQRAGVDGGGHIERS